MKMSNVNKPSVIGTLVLVVLLPINIFGNQPVQKIEPGFWWIGMKNKTLQLMVYGTNISFTRPTIDYPGVTIIRSSSLSNPNYLFIDLLITNDTHPGTFPINFYSKEKLIASYEYELKERQRNANHFKGFDNSDVLYLIMPDRFANGNPNNDTQPGMLEKANRTNPDGRHGGDLEGIKNHLNYLLKMGYTAIWLNPVLENDQPDFSYHGYAATDFYQVDRRFGTNEEYRELCDVAREKGIKVIMDMIFNHCGHSHWWMNDLPSDDWINNMPDPEYLITNHRKTLIQDPYRSKNDFDQLVNGWFVPTMPDLNQKNPYLATYLVQNSIWWIEYLGLAGIRMDTYPYPDMEMMSDWTCRIMEEYPEFNIVGEEFNTNPAMVAYWQGGKINPNGYTSCLPSVMDFPLQDAISRAMKEDEGWFDGLMRLYETLAMDFLYPNPDYLVVFPDNHDMDRIFTRIGEDFGKWKLSMAFTLTTRGIPQIYYGTEILMTGYEHEGHGYIREDFPGGWNGDKVNAFTGRGLTSQQKEAQEYLKTLLTWRKNNPVIHNGSLLHFIPENGVYVYFRMLNEKRVMVLLNKNKVPTELNTLRYQEGIQESKSGTDILSGTQVSLQGTISVPATTALILELE